MNAAPREGTALGEAITREAFVTEVRAWANRVGVRPKQITIRKMTSKWGSCSTTGRLTFDSDLMRYAAEFRSRVILEELLHMRIPNHSALFKCMLKAYLGQDAAESR